MLKSKSSISRNVMILGIISILSILITGIFVTTFMNFKMNSGIELCDKVASAKVATLYIESHFNMVSRLARNIMLGSNAQKDLERYKKSLTAMKDNFGILEKIASGNDKILVNNAKIGYPEILRCSLYF